MKIYGVTVFGVVNKPIVIAVARDIAEFGYPLNSP
jgi:hypothetical protein